MCLFSIRFWTVRIGANCACRNSDTVRTDSQINSASAHVGQTFHANLVKDLVVNGKTVAKAGAPAKGKITYAKSSGRLHAPGQVTIRLTSIELRNGKTTRLHQRIP